MKIVLFGIIIVLIGGQILAEEGFRYDPEGQRDPFVPLISEGGAYVSDAYGISSIKDVRLEGIVWDEDKGSIAVINGEIVREGQQIGAVKVLKIKKDAVTFDVNGEEVKIELVTD